MVGLDTGFFVALMKDDKEARQFWMDLSKREDFPVVSVLTIGEILYLAYRVGKPEDGQRMVKGIELAASVRVVDRTTTEHAASLKHSRGMPYVDALILATFVKAGCGEIHTADRSHFRNLDQEDIRLIYW